MNALLDTNQFSIEITKNLGATINQITTGSFKKMEFNFSISEVEQSKIGNFFQLLDQLITLQKRKVELMKELKKGLLQKLFPKNDKNVPEIRFVGYDSDWKKRLLGEISNIVGGGTPDTTVPEYWNGDIDWYSPAELGSKIYLDKSQKQITKLGLEKSSAKVLPVGTVLFTSRAGIGNTAILSKEGSTNQGFQSIIPKENLDSYFIFSRSSELKRYGEISGAGSTFVEVSGKQMQKMPLLVPDIKEQQKIGHFFQMFDQSVILHQQKLDKLTHLKKSYLQQMFI